MASAISSLSFTNLTVPSHQSPPIVQRPLSEGVDPSDCKVTESSDLLPPEIGLAVANGKMTDSLRSWLESQKWSREDIEDLSSIEGDEFFEMLFEQASYYKNEGVFDLIPSFIVDQIQERLIDKSDQFEALRSIICYEEEEEGEEAPNDIGTLPFLSREERELNREAYFSSFSGVMTEPFQSWLLTKGWSDEEVSRLGQFPKEEFLTELIFSALDREDYTLIQSIPKSFAETIIENLDSAIEIHDELLAFIEPFPDLDT
jgi:hypothetical protein